MSDDIVTLTFEAQPSSIAEMQQLQAELGSPNIATALYNATTLLLTLYQYQREGYELILKKGKQRRRVRLPDASSRPASVPGQSPGFGEPEVRE